MAEENEKAEDQAIEAPSPQEEKEDFEQIPEAQTPVKEVPSVDKKPEKKELPQTIPTTFLKQESPQDVYHTIKFMEDVPVRLYAEVARTETPLRDILSWKSGSIVKFDKVIGEPVDILIGDQLLARGEVVVVNHHFGIRISEITRSDEKAGITRQ